MFALKVVPTTLAGKAVEQLDRPKSYREVHDKVVSLVQSSSTCLLSGDMDCNQVETNVPGERGSWDADELSLDALQKDHCARCGGFGHYANLCAIPAGTDLGKGGGKGYSTPGREPKEHH